tara:strand:+ start:253 stop:1863 length:1611 start_codon:yes stop_codon:yes gene_type:complete
MARPVIGNPFDGQIGTVAPTAGPVDTYQRAVVKSSKFDALAGMLTRVSAKADPAIKAAEKRAAEREYQQGIQLYNDTRKSIGEAVKSGLIAEGASPYLRKGYRVSQMNTLAMRYTAELETALERQKLYTNNDPERIERFIEKFQDNFVEANGMSEFAKSEVAEYFGTPANKGNELFRAAWQDKHVAWQQEQNYIQFEAEVAETTINLFRPGMSDDERVIAMGSFAKWLENRSEAASIDGMKNSEVLKTILQGVGLAVEQTGDTDILEVFKLTKFGTEAASKSLSVQAKILDIEARALVLETRRAKQQDDEYDAITQTARTNARASTNEYLNNPTAENRSTLEGQIQTLLGYSDDESNVLALTLVKNLETYDTAARLGGQSKNYNSELMLDSELRNARTYNQASGIIENYANAGKIDANGVSTKLSLWRSQYDPANDTPFGLDFFSTSTPEGRAFADISSAVKGDPENYDENKIRHSITAKNLYRQRMRDAVQENMRISGKTSLSQEQMETISANVLTTVFTEIEAMKFISPLEVVE